jgi:hypothetical protein
LDISNPGAPTEVSSYDTPGYAQDVVVVDGRAYVADGESGLRILDVADVSAPAEIGLFRAEGGDIRGVQVAGSHAYLAAGNLGLKVVEVSDATNPREVGWVDTPGRAHCIHVSGSYAYIGDTDRLRVFDISTPSTPRGVASHKVPGTLAQGLWAEDGTAYVAAHQAGLLIFELEAAE